ncbi:Gfo/Idh/MocA family protein [Cohnella sp. 56]|uniref:Gfo/Idh/MocA family protein n=1 Tax=Cohnella sp. 56 TaxID=3113722 RepID=UPI0030E9AC62
MRLKLLQAGLGGHGRNVGSQFVAASPDFEYAGLIDPDPAALQAFASRHGISERRLYRRHEDALRETGADALLVTAASPVHFELCRAALEHGLHVLVEKPFTLTLQDAAELVRLAKERGLRLMVNQNYRYFSVVRGLRAALDDPSLGALRHAHAHFFFDHDGKPYQRQMDNYILMEMSVHHVDMIRYLLEDDIASVRGRTWNAAGSGYAGDPNVEAVYETKRGVPVFYASSLVAAGAADPWEGRWKFRFDRGAVYLDDMGEGYGVYVEAGDGAPRRLATAEAGREGIHGVLAEFAAAIREGREPSISGCDNLRTLAALLATGEASRTGREVRIASDSEERGANI